MICRVWPRTIAFHPPSPSPIRLHSSPQSHHNNSHRLPSSILFHDISSRQSLQVVAARLSATPQAMKNPRLWYNTIMIQRLIGITRHYKSNPKVDFKKLKPMILKRIENRAKYYPIKDMIPVANDVVRSRSLLIQGVSTLLQVIPIWSCKFCQEVYIGENGHAIKTCHGYKRHSKNKLHEWIKGGVNDILVPVNTFHLKHTFQNVIKHDERFDYNRIPAVLELAIQAGADLNPEGISGNEVETIDAESLSPNDVRVISEGTLKAWEVVRSGVKKLMMIYSAKVCKYCSEVHVGPSGHKARLCGVFKYERWRGGHMWKKAEVDDLVPEKVVWYRRSQDPVVLEDKWRSFYGHAPAVVDLCTKGGAFAPTKYYCMMKLQGLSADVAFKPRPHL